MSQGWKTSVTAAVLVALVISAPWGRAQAKRAAEDEALYKELELFSDALSIVQSDYVEEPEAHKANPRQVTEVLKKKLETA